MKLPKHIIFTLNHNDHAANYRTAEQEIEENWEWLGDDWVSLEQKAKAIATNEIWTAQWYPNTPIGFCKRHAADLDVLLKYLEGVADDD